MIDKSLLIQESPGLKRDLFEFIGCFQRKKRNNSMNMSILRIFHYIGKSDTV